MKGASVFTFDDYKDFLREKIKESEMKWGLVSRLAKSAGCQRSYLSRVLNSEIHLMPDHLLGLCRHWNLSDKETEYILNVLESERAPSLALKNFYLAKLKALKDEHESLQKKVNRPKTIVGERESTYYSSWVYSAVHILVSIPQFQTVKAIAEKLQIHHGVVVETLNHLKDMGLVQSSGGFWTFSASEIHVPKNSPFVSLHHHNWRNRAVLDAQMKNSEGLHFTVVQSIDKKAWGKIKNQILSMIEDASKTAGPSREELLVCLTLDFFEV